MFLQTYDSLPAKLDEEFIKPVESIMRCEDFKSNFARRLSNRYISRSPNLSTKQDNSLKMRPQLPREIPEHVPERIEQSSQLSKSSILEQNGEGVKPPDKSMQMNSDIQRTEVTALNMEVESLRWQLAQTEANRQMHIALLKQIVTFLNRVKDHIEWQKNDNPQKKVTIRQPQSFNVADLPRSKSVLHVNKNLEYTNSTKKIITRKISKSISNVNGYKDSTGVWNQSKLSLAPENETSQKISEEMSRLITLANTVLSTKLPDLACSCIDIPVETNSFTSSSKIDKEELRKTSVTSLNVTEEDTTNAFILNTICDRADAYDCITNKFLEVKDGSLNNYVGMDTPLSCGLENDFIGIKLNDKDRRDCFLVKNGTETHIKSTKLDRKNDYNQVSNFIEDESGFSSMSSFQEIGIPIISIIPPSPCKEVDFLDEMPDILGDAEKWKTDVIELDKQTVKVFWV